MVDIKAVVRAAIDTSKDESAKPRLRRCLPALLSAVGHWDGSAAGEFVMAAATPKAAGVLRRRVAGRRRERISNPRGCAGAGRGGGVLGREQERCDPGRNRGAARRGWVSGAAGGARADRW